MTRILNLTPQTTADLKAKWLTLCQTPGCPFRFVLEAEGHGQAKSMAAIEHERRKEVCCRPKIICSILIEDQ